MSNAPVLVPAAKRRVRLLIVDDSVLDAELMAAAIDREDYSPIFDHVNSPDNFRSRLLTGDYDVILCDHNLNTWMAKDALDIMQESGKQIPFVVVTGTLGDERAVQYLKDGACDYVLKERLERLPAAIGRALREKSQHDENARLQRAIWTAKKDWERTFDAIPDSIMLLDHEQRIARANRATADLLGLPFSQFLGKHCYEVVHCMSQPPASCPFQRMLLTSTKEEDEFVDSRLGKALHVIAIPLRDENGLYSAIHVIQDVTESRRLEGALRQAQKLEAVGRLAGGVAHDFNNILGVVLGYSELIQQEVADREPSSKYVQSIMGAVEQAKRVTSQLLAFSRKQVMQPRVLNLNEVVLGLSEMLHHLIGEDVELIVTPEADLGLVQADRVQIEQVLMNLVVNARDAVPKGGEIVIATTNVEIDHHQPVGMREPIAPGCYVMVSVRDTGVGMDEETMSHVFEPFYTTKEKEKGTGLGLAIVYGIVKQSSGYVGVESAPTRGSTFKIYLPRVTGVVDPASPKTTPAAVLAADHTETILLVEDEPDLSRVVSTVLDSSGYTVLRAANGEEALRIAEGYEGRIDLMLTDVVLPGSIDGTELAASLRKLRPETRLLFMSGYSDCLNGKDRDANSPPLLRKPFTVAELQSKVRELLTQT